MNQLSARGIVLSKRPARRHGIESRPSEIVAQNARIDVAHHLQMSLLIQVGEGISHHPDQLGHFAAARDGFV
jgi:hypothetical protein